MTIFGAIPPAEQTALRTGAMSANSYLAVAPPVAMMTARINQGVFNYPLAQITIDTIALAGGVALGDIPANSDVWIGSATGRRDVFIGRTRLDNSGDVVTANTLYIEEMSAGATDVPQVAYAVLADDLYITVLETSSLYYSLPNIVNNANTFTVFQDFNKAYTDQNTAPGPVANIVIGAGYSPAGFVDLTTSKYRAVLSGASSFQAITGIAPASYAWDIKDGVLISGTLASATITVDFPVGARWVELIVTDANAKTHTARFPLMYFSAAAPPLQVFSLQDSRTIRGRTMTISGDPNELNLRDVPHGALCIVFDDNRQGGAKSDYTVDYFLGFASQESAELADGITNIDMIVRGPVPFLDLVSQVPTRLEVADAPTSWQEAAQDYTNVAGVMHWIMSWKLPAFMSLFDIRFFPTSGAAWGDIPQPGFGSADVGGPNVGSSFQQLAGRLPGSFGSTSSGSIIFDYDPQYLSAANRAAWPVRASLDALIDFEAISYTREHRLKVGQVVADAFLYRVGAGVVPLKSVAPGLAPGQGVGRATLSGMIAQSQDQLNQVAGAHWAIENQPYTIQAPSLFPDVFEPCLRYRIALTISEADFNRVDFGEALRRMCDITDAGPVVGGVTRNFYIDSVTIERTAGGVKVSRYTLTPEITAVAGETLPIPQPSAYPGFNNGPAPPAFLLPGAIGVPDGSYDTYDLLPFPVTDIPTSTPPAPQYGSYQNPYAPAGSHCLAWGWDATPTDSELFITSNRFDVNPIWSDITPIDNEQVKYAIFKDSVGTVAYALTDDGADSTFWSTPDVFAPTPTWTPTALAGTWDYIRLGAAGVYVVSTGESGAIPASSETIFLDAIANAGQSPAAAIRMVSATVSGADYTVTIAGLIKSISQDIDPWYFVPQQTPAPNTMWVDVTKPAVSPAYSAGHSYVHGGIAGNGNDWGWYLNDDDPSNNTLGPFTITIETDGVAAGVPATRYSTDGGVTFGSIRLVTGLPAPGGGGADASKTGAPILAGANSQTRRAAVAGGTYADDPNHPFGLNPICLVVPTLTLNNAGANTAAADYIVASNVAASGLTVVAVSGAVQTDISPGAAIFATSPHCLVAHPANSGILVSMLLDLTTVKLYTSTNGGASWVEGDSFGLGYFPGHIRLLASDATGQTIFMTGGDKALAYSINGGATIVSNAWPGSGTAQGQEVYG